MTHVTCRLTAKNRDQLRNPTLGNRVWASFTFLVLNCRCRLTQVDSYSGRKSVVVVVLLYNLILQSCAAVEKTSTNTARRAVHRLVNEVDQ